MSKVEIHNVEGVIGAHVVGAKEDLLSGENSAVIRAALEERGILVFPTVNFSDEEQMEFTARLGGVAKEVTGEEVYKITMDVTKNASAAYLKGAFYWHIDGTMSDRPILASILSAKVLAPVGGNTEFCNTYAAYEALPAEERAWLDTLRVVHTVQASQLFVQPEPTTEEYAAWCKIGRNELPLVWKHASGRNSLILGATADYVIGMDPEESRALLIRLRDWCTRPEFVYVHEWTVGDTIMWDNTGTMHRATAYALDSGRMMHRTKLEGEEVLV